MWLKNQVNINIGLGEENAVLTEIQTISELWGCGVRGGRNSYFINQGGFLFFMPAKKIVLLVYFHNPFWVQLNTFQPDKFRIHHRSDQLHPNATPPLDTLRLTPYLPAHATTPAPQISMNVNFYFTRED